MDIENYKNRNLESIDGEIWVDAIGFDGIYEVSNMGRVKSLERWVNNGKSERLVKERILSIALCKDGHSTVRLSNNNISKSQPINQLVFYSFNENNIFDSTIMVIVRINKIPYDDRLCNLKLATRSESVNTSMKLGNLIPPVRGLLKYTKENVFIDYENGKEYKKCKNCNCFLEMNKFESFRNTCKECRNKARRK